MSKTKEILDIYPYIDFNGTSLWGFIVGKSASLIIHKTLGIPPTILKQYHPGTFLPVPMQNPCRLSLLCCVLEPDKLEGRFIQILLFFHVLLCGHCLNPDLFQNTGKLSKLFFKDILAQI